MRTIVVILSLFLLGCVGPEPKSHGVEGGEENGETLEEQVENANRRIERLQSKLFDSEGRTNDQEARQLLIAYQDFVNKFHENEQSPEYLFLAGSLARGLGKPRKAIEIYRKLHDGYPDYNKRVEAAYLVAFTYQEINDREMAQKSYEKVIEFYPESKWAKDAEDAIAILYLTDEQLIEKFKNQN